jgi:hypothetical protein
MAITDAIHVNTKRRPLHLKTVVFMVTAHAIQILPPPTAILSEPIGGI